MTKRILIFNVNWLGDVLFSTAAIRNIRRNFPDSYIACIIPSHCYPILKGNPNLDEIIIFDERDRHKGIVAKLKFIQLIKAKKFDLVYLLHRSFSRAFICFLAGIPQRVGYYTKKRGFLLTQKIPAPSINSMHRIDYYLNIIEKAGIKIEDRYPALFISDEDQRFVDNFLSKNSIFGRGFLVVLNPGGNWFPKRWPKEYWAELADRLISELKAKVIITGGSPDIKDAEEIKGLMKNEPIIASGQLNLKQFAALCKKVDIFVTADTGPLHIANAIGAKKIIALFGPTSPAITGPYPLKNVIIMSKDIGCKVPCYVVNCRDNRCMKSVTSNSVFEQIRLLKVDN